MSDAWKRVEGRECCLSMLYRFYDSSLQVMDVESFSRKALLNRGGGGGYKCRLALRFAEGGMLWCGGGGHYDSCLEVCAGCV